VRAFSLVRPVPLSLLLLHVVWLFNGTNKYTCRDYAASITSVRPPSLRVGIINLELLKGRCHNNKLIFGPNQRNWPTLPSFLALAFRNRSDDRNG